MWRIWGSRDMAVDDDLLKVMIQQEPNYVSCRFALRSWHGAEDSRADVILEGVGVPINCAVISSCCGS